MEVFKHHHRIELGACQVASAERRLPAAGVHLRPHAAGYLPPGLLGGSVIRQRCGQLLDITPGQTGLVQGNEHCLPHKHPRLTLKL